MAAIAAAYSESNAAVTNDSELRFLPSWARSQLAHILEVNQCWQRVMGHIPSPPWHPGEPIPQEMYYPRKYSSDDIHMLSEECTRIGREGFEVLVEEWGTSGRKRPMVLDLVMILQRCKLYRAMDYLTVNVLNGEPLPREERSPEDLMEELDLVLEAGHLTHHQEIVESPYVCEGVKDDPSYLYSGDSGYTERTSPMLRRVDDATKVMEASGNELSPQVVASSGFDATVLEGMDSSGVPHFRFNSLKEITNNFSNIPVASGGNKLGEGAFGVVYLAKLFLAGREKRVAIKKLNSGETRVEQQFKTEIEILSKCIHENLLALEGYSCDGEDWCLVYTYMANGSLQDRLACSEGSLPLDWVTRMRIGKGAASGIVHLHTYQERPLVHRDIKTANILLDEHFIPKVGDFGLVHLGGSGANTRTLIKTTTVFGTSAYMAPEAFRGDISVKMDTFSFGIVLLELLTGLASYDEEREGYDLLSFVMDCERELADLLDTKAGEWDIEMASELFSLAELCTVDKKRRPTMVETLEKYSTITQSVLNAS